MAETCVVAIGKESTGKTELVAALTGRRSSAANFRGSTVSCDFYRIGDTTFVDTPGIFRTSDTETTRNALDQLARSDRVLLVLQATHLDEDLAELLPLARGKRGAGVVTFWDKLGGADHRRRLAQVESGYGLSLVPVDARRLSEGDRAAIFSALDTAPVVREPEGQPVRAGWRVEPRRTWLEHPWLGSVTGLAALLVPAMLAVWVANTLAGRIDPAVQAATAVAAAALDGVPYLLHEALAGRFGTLTMGPLLFVWAVPTVLLYALVLGAYKASGLLERISVACDPLLRPFGLAGRDLVRVMMGFGCNVPAVVCTRACSACSRPSAIAAIAFGSACSYQLGATLAVFAAAGRPGLVAPYLGYLALTTLVYLRLVAGPRARSLLDVLVVRSRGFLSWPSPGSIWREMRGMLVQFFRKAVPVFLLITLVASLLDAFGVVEVLAATAAPLAGLFRLPAETALPLMLSAVRKDGILLFAEPSILSRLTPLQVLTGVYLAGVLLPCLVTAWTIGRERSFRFVLTLMAKQALAACAFAALLAWGGLWLE